MVKFSCQKRKPANFFTNRKGLTRRIAEPQRRREKIARVKDEQRKHLTM